MLKQIRDAYMKITEQEAQEIYYDEKYVAVEEGGDHRWWRPIYVTFSSDGKFYQFMYMQPLTEVQEDQDRFEVDRDGMIECYEVEPYEFKETRYRGVKTN